MNTYRVWLEDAEDNHLLTFVDANDYTMVMKMLFNEICVEKYFTTEIMKIEVQKTNK